MMNVIKTAIITIIISVISGLLLEYCKNLAPRILCTVGNGVPIRRNGKKVYAYIITVKNLSNKIVHELTLNIQSLESSLKITDTKITEGLKFDSSMEDNAIDVEIPFLNKDDEFSAKVYAENQYGLYDKPTVVIRSPEKFKEVDSADQKGILSLFNKDVNQTTPKAMRQTRSIVPDERNDYTMVMDRPAIAQRTMNKRNREVLHRNRKASSNSKKAIIIITSIALFIIAGVFVKSYFKDNSNTQQAPAVENTIPEQSAGTTGSSKGTTKNRSTRTSTNGATGNTGSKTSTSGTTGETNGNANSKTSTGETSGDAGSKTSTGETSGNADSKASTGGTTGNSNTKSSTSGTTGNSTSNTSSGGTESANN